MNVIKYSQRKTFLYRGIVYTTFANFSEGETPRLRTNPDKIKKHTPFDYNFSRFRFYTESFGFQADIYLVGSHLLCPTEKGFAEYIPPKSKPAQPIPTPPGAHFCRTREELKKPIFDLGNIVSRLGIEDYSWDIKNEYLCGCGKKRTGVTTTIKGKTEVLILCPVCYKKQKNDNKM